MCLDRQAQDSKGSVTNYVTPSTKSHGEARCQWFVPRQAQDSKGGVTNYVTPSTESHGTRLKGSKGGVTNNVTPSAEPGQRRNCVASRSLNFTAKSQQRKTVHAHTPMTQKVV